MNKYNWKRFTYFNVGVILFFAGCGILYFVNEKLSTPILPQVVIGYFFWLGLGMVIGFSLCRHEMERVIFGKDKNKKPE